MKPIELYSRRALRAGAIVGAAVAFTLLGCAATRSPTAAHRGIRRTVEVKDGPQSPEYWIKKLEDAASRPDAVRLLEQFYEDTITRANMDKSASEVKTLVDKIVVPLRQAYVQHYPDFDTKTRVTLIKLLSELCDPRSEPALRKALEEFTKQPPSNRDDQDVKWAARGTGALRLASMSEPLFLAFMKLQASTMLGGVTYRDMSDALRVMPQASWVGRLCEKLESPIIAPRSSRDTELIDRYRDQVYWQETSAQLLGILKDEAAVEPLLKVLLDPAKEDIQQTAQLALTKIGRPAVTAAVRLLCGENERLKATAHSMGATERGKSMEDDYEVRVAARVLGSIGHPDALTPLLEVLKSTKNASTRAIIAREITRIPATGESKSAFKAAFESIPLHVDIIPGGTALSLLAEASWKFFDPTMIPWLLERAAKTRGDRDSKEYFQHVILGTVLALATLEQIGVARAAVARYGYHRDKEQWPHVENLLRACNQQVDCYLDEITKDVNQSLDRAVVAAKASTMVVIYGSEQTRGELIGRLNQVDSNRVVYAMSVALDALSPQGSKDAAQRLNALITRHEQAGNRTEIDRDSPLKEVAARIESRTE